MTPKERLYRDFCETTNPGKEATGQTIRQYERDKLQYHLMLEIRDLLVALNLKVKEQL